MSILEEKEQAARQQDSASQSNAPPPHNRQPIRRRPVTDGFVLPDLEVPSDAPPAYGAQHDHMAFSQPGFDAGATVTGDGRINININTKNRRLADLLGPAIAREITAQPALPPAYQPPSLADEPGKEPPPPLNIVIQIVGSRGDVQPFVALGKVLKETYGHRIRVATHPTFEKFVEENGLEFFSIGGDPAELMAFMVKHPGLMPGLDALKSGEISKRRKGVEEMLLGCWRSCIEAGNGLGPPPRPHTRDQEWDPSTGMPGDPGHEPFVADAIIANPPSFAHIHIAEKLGIPLHMMFTMPWSPTRAFPHPLANIQSSNADDVLTNYLTYTLVEMMTWQGLGDVINRFREKALDLAPLALIWAPGLLNRLRISYTYCWSPALIPKPNDWGTHIDISGFYFLNLASSYAPAPELAEFLEAGPPPVYIGFGSIVVDDPDAMTRMIFDAVHLSGVRALVSKGWGGLGADAVGLPEGVFMLGNVPHDWLFERVSAVVHHGGAGTTAAGIKAGKPTIVVPFFGDQPFWGAMIARANAGPDPIPHKTLTAEKLAEAIKYCLQDETQNHAKLLGERIREEKGCEMGARSFHNHLNVDILRCAVAPSRAATWRVRRTKVRLSAFAATVLVNSGQMQYSDLKLYRPYEYDTEDQPPEPITAGAMSLVSDISDIGLAIVDMPREIFKSHQKKKEAARSNSKSLLGSDTASQRISNTELSSVVSGETSRTDSTTPRLSSSLYGVSQQSLPLSQDSPYSERLVSPVPSHSQVPEGGSVPRTETPTNSAALEATIGTTKNIGRIINTGVKSPMNFCLGLAKGFRNIPRLYNDDTVRSIDKVTDLNSGLKVATKELGFGFYDGISGVVTQPIRGAQKEGAAGLFKGIGKGIGGLISKPAAGIWGVPAYLMQGAYAEANKMFARSVQNYIITSRVVQGERDFSRASDGEKADILDRWNDDVLGSLASFPPPPSKFMGKEEATEKGPLRPPETSEQEEAGSTSTNSKAAWPPSPTHVHTSRLRQLQEIGMVDDPASDLRRPSTDTEYEEAIRASVMETSRGNAEEDAMIEAAIRESVAAAMEHGSLPDPIQYSLDSKHPSLFLKEEYQITDEEYQDLIEQAIRESVSGNAGGSSRGIRLEGGIIELDAVNTAIGSRGPVPHPDSDSGSPTPETDEDADLQRAIEESRRAPPLPPRGEAEDHELEAAIAASKHQLEKEQSQQTEEDIVMEYIKKQSLAEDVFRKQQLAKGKGVVAEHQDDDEELKRAIEESLKLHTGGNAGPSGSSEQR